MRTGPPFPAGEPVTVVRAPTVTDRYNNQVPDWDNATEFVLAGCAIAPAEVPGVGGNTAEFTDGRELGVQVDHTLYVTPDAGTGIYGWSVYGEPLEAIWPSDALRFRGYTHAVVGPIDVWVNPSSGNRPGCVVRTTRSEG